MRFLPVGLFLFASTALGQTLTLTVDNTTDTTKVIGLNRDDCGTDLDLDWTFQGGTACDDLQLWVTSGASCGDAPVAGDYVLDEVPRANVGTPGTEVRRIEVDRLPAFSADAGTACAASNVDVTMRVCGFTQAQGLTACDIDIKVSTPPKIRFDTQAPAKPTISSVTPRDSALGVSVAAESGSTVVVRAYVREADGGVGSEVASDETSGSEGTAELTGLQNGVTYSVTAVATDESGNPSDPSDPSEGTPIASRGFYGAYLGAGGTETGGCGATGGGIAAGAVLAALGFWLSRRKLS